jgi:hypothetical protein
VSEGFVTTAVLRRTTCLYCAQGGVETRLVSTHLGPTCPIHSKDVVEEFQAWALDQTKDPLLDKGRPTINGEKR